MPNRAEVAAINVEGVVFEDWDTVWVQHQWQGGWQLFRFTCAERSPMPTRFDGLKFKPGDRCIILLGGKLGMLGLIQQRQTSYDATTHTVTLSGVSPTWGGATSSVNTKNGSFDGLSATQVAFKTMGQFCPIKIIGKIDETPLQNLQCHPGETNFDFLDRVARMVGFNLASDHEGKFLLIGQHVGQHVADLVEGQNILKMVCTFSNEHVADFYAYRGQGAVDDNTPMRVSAEFAASVKGTSPGVFKRIDTVLENPVKVQAQVNARANYEAAIRESTLITAVVTVQGWLRDGTSLWRPGENVSIHSPMALLDKKEMKVRTATFTQDDNSGTTTTLECVLPLMLGDQYAGRGAQKKPPPATPDYGPPAVTST